MLAILNRFFNWLSSLLWKKEMEMAVIGLQGAGKTTFVNLISTGNFVENTIPTVGFNMRKVTKNNVAIKVWDVGGQKKFRSMWQRYCKGVDAILFVVDSSDEEKIEESKKELHALLAGTYLADIPLLVLGNKNDLSDAVHEGELIEKMELETLNGREVCCYSVSCKCQTNIDCTLRWLIAHAK